MKGPHARYVEDERAFHCVICRMEKRLPEVIYYPDEIRQHLKTKHGVGIRQQLIIGWNSDFQKEYLRKRKKHNRHPKIDWDDMIIKQKKSSNQREEERNAKKRQAEDLRTERDSY